MIKDLWLDLRSDPYHSCSSVYLHRTSDKLCTCTVSKFYDLASVGWFIYTISCKLQAEYMTHWQKAKNHLWSVMAPESLEPIIGHQAKVAWSLGCSWHRRENVDGFARWDLIFLPTRDETKGLMRRKVFHKLRRETKTWEKHFSRFVVVVSGHQKVPVPYLDNLYEQREDYSIRGCQDLYARPLEYCTSLLEYCTPVNGEWQGFFVLCLLVKDSKGLDWKLCFFIVLETLSVSLRMVNGNLQNPKMWIGTHNAMTQLGQKVNLM